MTEKSIHSTSFRIYYEDTDAGGVVYYANYLKFAERARTEWLRDLGFEQETTKREMDALIMVRSCQCEFIAPAKLDDKIVIETILQEVGKVRMTMQQTIKCAEKTLVTLQVDLVCVNNTGKATRWPKVLTDAFV